MSHLYVIQFSTGAIKVGRTDGPPEDRIAEHEARFAPAGVVVSQKRHFECMGDPALAELALIRQCSQLSQPSSGREWFHQIAFDAVCDWAADHAASSGSAVALDSDGDRIASLIDQIAAMFGGFGKFAESLGVATSAPSMWKKRGNVPAEYCPSIERETAKLGMRVACELLRPDVDWAVLREFAHTKAEA